MFCSGKGTHTPGARATEAAGQPAGEITAKAEKRVVTSEAGWPFPRWETIRLGMSLVLGNI